jgi:hypothetical protein
MEVIFPIEGSVHCSRSLHFAMASCWKMIRIGSWKPKERILSKLGITVSLDIAELEYLERAHWVQTLLLWRQEGWLDGGCCAEESERES